MAQSSSGSDNAYSGSAGAITFNTTKKKEKIIYLSKKSDLLI